MTSGKKGRVQVIKESERGMKENGERLKEIDKWNRLGI